MKKGIIIVLAIILVMIISTICIININIAYHNYYVHNCEATIMIVNRYILDNRISEADKNRIRQNCVKSYRNHILRIIDKEYCQVFEKNYLFSSVEIETINRCNGSCPFCPVNRRHCPVVSDKE